MRIEIKNGAVTKDGEELGVIRGDTCHLSQKCAPVIKGKIREVAGDPELKFVAEDAADEGCIPALPPAEEANAADPRPERDLIRGEKCPELMKWKARQPKEGK